MKLFNTRASTNQGFTSHRPIASIYRAVESAGRQPEKEWPLVVIHTAQRSGHTCRHKPHIPLPLSTAAVTSNTLLCVVLHMYSVMCKFKNIFDYMMTNCLVTGKTIRSRSVNSLEFKYLNVNVKLFEFCLNV